jgi:hypothetical protein
MTSSSPKPSDSTLVTYALILVTSDLNPVTSEARLAALTTSDPVTSDDDEDLGQSVQLKNE